MGCRIALLVATYEYQDAGLSRLTAPAHDVEALAEVLQDPTIAGFEVTTLINEPYSRVGQAIGDLYRDRRRDDLTLLYFTGHGLKDDAGRLYLAMTDTRRDGLMFSGLSAEHIDQTMDSSVSHQQVLILDCCYSGSYPASRGVKGDDAVHTLSRLGGRGRTVLTSSDATQYAFEGDELSGAAAQSLFTRFFVEGIRGGSADADGDGEIGLDELYAFVHDNVVRVMPHQRPKKKEDMSGRIFIARNVHWTIPEYLLAGLKSPIVDSRRIALRDLIRLYSTGNEFVRGLVLVKIRGLLLDDSKSVSAAARRFLAGLAPPTPFMGWRGGFTRFAVGSQGRLTSQVHPVPDLSNWGSHDVVLDGVEIKDENGTTRVRLRAASVRGLGHRVNGMVRQDDYAFRRTDDGKYLVVGVSDGVVSGELSHYAATLVVREGSRLLAARLADDPAESVDWIELMNSLSEGIVSLGRRMLGPKLDRREVATHMAATAVFGVVDLRPVEGKFSVYACRFGDSAASLLFDDGRWQSVFPLQWTSENVRAHALPLPVDSKPVAMVTTLRSGEALVLMTDGINDPLGDGSGEVGRFLAEVWREPPEPLAFAAQVDFDRRYFTDDRTALAIWPVRE